MFSPVFLVFFSYIIYTDMTVSAEQYRRIYDMLNHVEVLPYDCGRLCHSVCCQPENDRDMGMYLFPGEEAVHDQKDPWLFWRKVKASDHQFPPGWPEEVWYVNCYGPAYCKRKKRPLQCRFFPVTAHLDEEDRLSLVRFDLELPYYCPLLEESFELNEDWLEAVWQAYSILLSDPAVYDMIKQESNDRIRINHQIHITYKKEA